LRNQTVTHWDGDNRTGSSGGAASKRITITDHVAIKNFSLACFGKKGGIPACGIKRVLRASGEVKSGDEKQAARGAGRGKLLEAFQKKTSHLLRRERVRRKMA